jgi:hypothetical protein
MDQQELDDWRDFCEGTKSFEPEHFSRMFMEMFFEPTEKDRADLRTVFSYVPNSAHTLEMMLRICAGSEPKTAQEITDLVLRDLQALRPLVTHPEVLRAMDFGAREITGDQSRFRETADTTIDCEFHAAIGDYVIHLMYSRPEQESTRKLWGALWDAFYGIACNTRLQMTLAAELIGCDVSFHNYFELYLSGVDYALSTTGAVVYNYHLSKPTT